MFSNRIDVPGLNGILEIAVLAVLLYYIFLFFQGTRGAQVLSGLGLFFVSLLLLTQVFNLDTLNWLLQRFTVYLAIAFLIIFQPEIRRALAELGRRHMFATPTADRPLVEVLVKAATRLADGKIGALIAIERETSTAPYQETGTPIESRVTAELIQTIFYPNTILHDGAIIVRGDRIVAAGCVFPLSQRTELSKSLGTRHRAAIGLTEETDALVIVVSEETGTISVAYRGRLRQGLDTERLERILSSILSKGRAKAEAASSSRIRRVIESWWPQKPRAARPAEKAEEAFVDGA